MNPTIAASEVAEVFRKTLRGEVTVAPVELDWNYVYCGNVEFSFADWRIVIFNDCGDLDYVDHVVAPDGRAAEFDDWDTDRGVEDPVCLLTPTEATQLRWMLEDARAEPAAGRELN